ncbi:MAG: hypothetical protein AAF771_04610 [Pseudomonadota bacterium]
MSSQDLSLADQPLHKAAQRLRWFLGAFEGQVARTEEETGNRYAVDEDKLAAVFVDWLKAFNAQKPASSDDKVAYVGFAAGLMLRTLVSQKPVAVEASPEGADQSNPAYFWPEGYLYVAFCLNVRGLVLENEFHEIQHPGDALTDPRTWWSFRENVANDPSLAIAFLDLFAGDAPEWEMPQIFRTGRVRAIAERFFEAREIPQD